jgi:hypothetical protein
MPFNVRISRKEAGVEIPGTYLHAFVHNGDYFLTEVRIYADGKIDCWEMLDFPAFQQKVRSGRISTQLPEGAKLSISGLASLRATKINLVVDPEEFIKEVADEIRVLNGEASLGDKCQAAYEAFLKHQSESARDALRSAYEAVPAHLRRYVLRDQDAKDRAIKDIISGDKQ